MEYNANLNFNTYDVGVDQQQASTKFTLRYIYLLIADTFIQR